MSGRVCRASVRVHIFGNAVRSKNAAKYSGRVSCFVIVRLGRIYPDSKILICLCWSKKARGWIHEDA